MASLPCHDYIHFIYPLKDAKTLCISELEVILLGSSGAKIQMRGVHFLEVLAATEEARAAHVSVWMGPKACYLLRALGGGRHYVQLEKSEGLHRIAF